MIFVFKKESYSYSLHATETGISTDLMDHLAHSRLRCNRELFTIFPWLPWVLNILIILPESRSLYSFGYFIYS